MSDSTPQPLPPAMIKRAREFSGPPAPVRPAATVVLLRPAKGPEERPGTRPGERPETRSGERTESHAGDPETHTGDTDFQVYVIQRASTMVFGGLYAFPGGGVDPSDCPETIRADWSDLLGVSNDQARAVVGAAARELFEEAGVLLAGPADQPDRTVSDVSTDDWEADRAAVQARELSMTELLGRRGLLLRDDLLLPWGRWITPVFEPRRFDTWFFVSLLPQGQTARDVSGEADGTQWIRPEAADGLAMLPPTRRTLNSLTPYGKMEEVVAASSRRDAATPIMPRVEFTEDGGALLHIQ